jgi:hypothetical protein
MAPLDCPACGAPVSAADELRGECPRCRKPLAVGVAVGPRSEGGSQSVAHAPSAHFPPFDGPAAAGAASWRGPRAGLLLLIIWAILALVLNLASAVVTLCGALVGGYPQDAFQYASLVCIGQIPVGLLALVGTVFCCFVPRKAEAGGWAASAISSLAGGAGLLALSAGITIYEAWGGFSALLVWPFFACACMGLALLGGWWVCFCLLLRRVALHFGTWALGREFLLYLVIALSACFFATCFSTWVYAADWYHGNNGPAVVLVCWTLFTAFGTGSLGWLLSLFLRLRSRMAMADAGESPDDAAFAAELDRRYAEVQQDPSAAVPWPDVMREE